MLFGCQHVWDRVHGEQPPCCKSCHEAGRATVRINVNGEQLYLCCSAAAVALEEGMPDIESHDYPSHRPPPH